MDARGEPMAMYKSAEEVYEELLHASGLDSRGEPVAMYQSADKVYGEYVYASELDFIQKLETDGYPEDEMEEVKRMYENEYMLLAPVSLAVHDQGSEPICYSFSVATLLRATLKRVGREREIGSHESVVEEIQDAVKAGKLDLKEGSTVGALKFVAEKYNGLVFRQRDVEEAVQILRAGERSLAMSFGLSLAEWDAFSKFFRDGKTKNMTLTWETLDAMVANKEKAKWGGGAGGRHSVVATGFEGEAVRFKNSWGGEMGFGGTFHVAFNALTEVKFWDLQTSSE